MGIPQTNRQWRFLMPMHYDIQGKIGEPKLTGKKLLLGTLIVLLLIFAIAAFESVENYWVVLSLWIILTTCVALFNNALCRRWLSFDKLQTYKYSWRQFGIIVLILVLSRYGRADYAVPHSRVLSESIAFYLFFGYLLFYLGERYVKRRVLNKALKSLPFLVFIVLFLIQFVSVSGIFQPTKPKAVRYLDAHSGEVFEISGEDIEKEFSILGEFAKVHQNLDSYNDLLDRYWEGTIAYKTFIKETSRIEGGWDIHMKNMENRAHAIKSPLLRNILLDVIALTKDDFSACVKIKEGVENSDSTAIYMGMELVEENYSKRLQFLKDYSSIVRIEPGDRLDEQRSIGLIRVEWMKIENNLNLYESAFLDLSYEHLTLREFKQKMSYYESILTDYFQKCDSLMECIKNPEALVFLQKYLNYNDIYGSISYQKFQTLSSLVKAYIDYDSTAYSVNYTKYIDLCKKSENFLTDFLSNFLQE